MISASKFVELRTAQSRWNGTMPTCGDSKMRDIILWLAGVPIVVIVGLHLTGFLH